MDVPDRVKFLKQVSIFAESPDTLILKVAEKVTEINVATGDTIVLKGEQGNSMYFIVGGSAMVHDGDHVFTTLRAGGFFGKYYLIDKMDRSASVTAVEPCHLLSLDHDLFRAITGGENTVVTGILKALVGRLREMNVAEEQLAAQNQEIEKQKEELEKQRLELFELNATKDKFFSIIAHDLRSPITTLISLSDILRTEKENLTPDQNNEVITSLYDLSKNYLKLLDNLLQWSKMQTGGMEAVPEIFNLTEVIADAVTIYKTTAAEKQISLVNNVQMPVMVFADINMIRTVVRNLVSNALKYTNKNGIVSISKQVGESQVTVSVQDNGIGMSSDMVERLFLLDKAFSTRGTSNEKGTGLGLILCKDLLKKNDGSLQVISEPGTGTTFLFTLTLTPR